MAADLPQSISTTPTVLCVDLDGTLVATDTLWESLVTVLSHRPMAVFSILWALIQGKARFKSAVARYASLEVGSLPFRSDLLGYLKKERDAHRRLVLVTAAHRSIAEAVAGHLGIFDDVIATDGDRNVKGREKGRLLVERFGEKGFSYVGDSAADLEVWQHAATAIPVGAPAGVVRRLQSPIEASFPGRTSNLGVFFRAIRLHQWTKNLLVFVPLFTSKDLLNFPVVGRLLAMVFLLGLVASAQYLVNDLIDLESDRGHPEKRLRPLASGELSIPAGLLTAVGLLSAGLLGGYFIGAWQNVSLLGAYFVVSLLYSIWLKTQPLLDVFVLTGLYVFRVVIGGVVSDHHVTAWLLNFVFLSFLGLAFLKRHVEIIRAGIAKDHVVGRRGYYSGDAPVVIAMGLGSSFTAAVVLALYINSESANLLYRYPMALWGFIPVYLLTQGRLWLSASRGYIGEDPVRYAISDRMMWGSAALSVMIYLTAVGWTGW